MNRAFTILRTAREARHLTLTDIADATLINIEHLRAIDEGREGSLPEAYMRAFMREYASLVGVDPQELMQIFDDERAEKPATKDGASERDDDTFLEAPPAFRPSDFTRRFLDSGQYTRTVVTLVGLAFAAIVSWNLFGAGTLPMKQIPFREVVKENEELAGIPPATHPSSRTKADSLATASASGDSLTLVGRTTDSVWVRMMIDDEAPKEYLFGPRAKVTWHGRSQILFFTIGNAGALELFLNGKSLGAAGKPGHVIQKLVISRKGIIIPGTEPPARRDSDASDEIGAMPVAPLEAPRQ